jgi:hypothetical protein
MPFGADINPMEALYEYLIHAAKSRISKFFAAVLIIILVVLELCEKPTNLQQFYAIAALATGIGFAGAVIINFVEWRAERHTRLGRVGPCLSQRIVCVLAVVCVGGVVVGILVAGIMHCVSVISAQMKYFSPPR